MSLTRPLPLLMPDRVRRLPRSFAWLDHRLRTHHFFEQLGPAEIGLYLFLAIAADAQGLSCWRLDRVERTMPCLDLAALRRARSRLVAANLLAYRPWHTRAVDGSYQLLAVPKAPSSQQHPSQTATIGQLLPAVLPPRR